MKDRIKNYILYKMCKFVVWRHGDYRYHIARNEKGKQWIAKLYQAEKFIYEYEEKRRINNIFSQLRNRR